MSGCRPSLGGLPPAPPEPPCLARTPSGTLYIPGDLAKTLNSPHHKSELTRSALQDERKTNPDRCHLPAYGSGGGGPVPVLPVRTNLRRPLSGQLSQSRFQLAGKSFSSRCSWKCAAVCLILVALVLVAALAYFVAVAYPKWKQSTHLPCPVLVDDMEVVQDRTQKSPSTMLPSKTLPPRGDTFTELRVGRRHVGTIPAFGHWNVQFTQRTPSLVRFNYTLSAQPGGASVGVYARRNALPTHTRYDFQELLQPREPRASSKSSKDSVFTVEFIQFLDRGMWYISLYNDGSHPQEIAFTPHLTDESSLPCPYDCHGHGTCILGTCTCNPDYAGESCAYRVCPVLCSGRGQYVAGECVCNPGWKGRECQLREDECEVADCSGHGDCLDGRCRCFPGYQGPACEEVDCLDPLCSGHGACVQGRCLCRKGWKGADCSEADTEALRCLPDCTGHGHFDLELQKCNCDERWTGPDCSQERCGLDCGPNGRCQGGECVCLDGWTGPRCTDRLCDPRCQEHGQCRNGTCVCIQGWNGRHCTIEGCPEDCHGHGECVRAESGGGDWQCECAADWEGAACNVAVERRCADGRDNDGDGLVDCADTECCPDPSCQDSPFCFAAADPLDILLRKQPPAVTASFFQRMQFLIEENSVQSYAHKNAFNDSRASVIRGRVVGTAGTGLVGIRVGITSDPLYGFTLTRDTGWFDLMVNGGGAAKLQFQREPFLPTERIVTVPWNQIVVIEPVVMTLKEGVTEPTSTWALDPAAAKSPSSGGVCLDHDYDTMRPVVLATWKHGFQGGCPDKSAILIEPQVVQESLPVPGSDFHLVYHSSRVSGYLSTIQLQLTPESVPLTLRRVHLRISIEGILFEKTFEADPAIKYTYAWNRRNVYRQKVYGVTPATVYVGYEYSNCPQTIWEVQTTQVSGHDMSISEIGGWNVAIHHRYNFHEGILQKGDGSNIYLKTKPKMLVTTMGDGTQRPLHCSNCEGPARAQQLLAPVALASAPDGSIYVGDFNLVRKITPQGIVTTVVELSAAQVAYRYRLAVAPLDGRVYISDPERHQILAVRVLTDIPDVRDNIDPVVGSGAKCLPGDRAMCGDGRPARDARLAYPKGITVSASNEIFIADGTNIRMVERNGIIRTIVGDYYHKSHWKPMPCAKTILISQANLRWPTELALNPLDGSLHILDDHMIFKLTPDNRLKMVAGRPLQCPTPPASREKSDMATEVYLDSPQSIAFAPNGDLYIAESDSQMVNWVRVVGSDGRITKFAGAESKCSCLESDCKCFDEDHYLAATAKFSTITSITVTPDGLLHICDQGNLRIRSVIAPLPKPNEMNEYEIYSPETQDVYIFNRHGQHITTKNVLTGKAIYTFSYNVNTSFGKLSTVTDAAGNKIYIIRDYIDQVNTIENTQGGKCRLEISRMRMLQSFTTPSNFKTTFDYHGITSLLRSKIDSTGRAYMHDYDEYGRLTQSVLPSGQTVRLEYNLSIKGASVTVTRDYKNPVTLMIKGYGVITKIGDAEDSIVHGEDGGLALAGQDTSLMELGTVSNPLLADLSPVLGEIFPLATRLRTTYNEEANRRYEWRYYIRRDGRTLVHVGRKLKLNGEAILSVDYDREKSAEMVSDRNQIALVTATYDVQGRPLQFVPGQNVSGVHLEYDRYGRPVRWERGPLSLRLAYDIRGRLAEVRQADDTSTIYKYEEADLPAEIILPRGSRYLLQYDHSGSLQAVITPNGHKHEIATQTSFGFYKLLYLSPGVRYPYVIHYDDQGRITAKLYPQNLGRVVYVYNSEGRIQTIFCGDEKTEYSYLEQTSLVRSVAMTSSKLDFRVDYRYHGNLLKEERLRYNSRSGMDGAKFKYKTEGRQLSVDTEVNGKPIAELKYRYNGETGMLEQVNQFLIHRPKINSVFLQDDMRHYSKTIGLDPLGRVTVLAMTLWNKEIFSLTLSYDIRSRIKQTILKIGRDSSLLVTNYTYTVDNFLEEATGAQSWKFTYDINGNMKSITNGAQQLSLRYDDGDRLIGYGDVELYLVDGRGFVIQRGEERFKFNSKAQLVHAFELDQYEVFFYYDVMDRVAARVDHRGNITQFFYSNPKDPYKLTHVHYPKDGITFILLYDTDGNLIYMQEGSNKYYIASDHLGTPVAVFNSDGKLVKQVTRAPFGKVLQDTNPDFYVPVDFRSGIRDPITQIVFFKGRAYDPLCSQWLTPNWEDVPKILKKPYNLHLYRFNGNNPINPNADMDNYLTDFSSWLRNLGYESIRDIMSPSDPSSLVTAANLPSKVFATPTFPESIPVISGLSCTAELMKNEFSRFSTVAQFDFSVLDAIYPPINRKLANLMSVLGDGIVISTFQKKAMVHVVSDASPILRDVITSVFNDTYVVDISFSLHGQDSFFFVQEDRSKAQGDWDQIQRLGTMFNVTMHSVDTSEMLSRSGQKDLRVHSTSVVLNIRYGSTLFEERMRLLRHIRRKAIEDAWLQEKESIQNGRGGRHEWTKVEKEELLLTGTVSRYNGVEIHSVEKYPFLVDDPTNVLFKKESSRKRRGHSRRPKR